MAGSLRTIKRRKLYCVLTIVAGILVVRHLKTADDGSTFPNILTEEAHRYCFGQPR